MNIKVHGHLYKSIPLFLLVTLLKCTAGKIAGIGSSQQALQASPTSNTKTTTNTTTTTTTETLGAASLSFSDGSSYNFGTTVTGAVIEKSLTLSNSGQSSASSLSITVSSPFAFNGGSFPGTGGTCTTTLVKGATCKIVVTFTSSSVVSSSGSLSVSYNDGASAKTFSFDLSGAAAKYSQQQRLVATGTNARNIDDRFGYCVTIYQDTMAVSGIYHDYDETGGNSVADSGAVWIYTRSGTTWTLQQKIVGQGTNGRVGSDYFGHWLTLYENTLAVTSYGQDFDEAGANSASSAGAVFVFVRTGTSWALQQKLVGSGTNGRVAGDAFGYSISLYGDTLAVGARFQDYDETGGNSVTNAGAVYVYVRSGSTWTLQQKIVGSGTYGRNGSDYLGTCISLYGDTIAVGSEQNGYDENGANGVTSAGAVFVFTRTGGVWSLQQKVVAQGTNSRGNTDRFGNFLNLNDNTLAVGAPFQDYDENGANLVTDAGAVFIYTRTNNVWTFQQKLVATGTNARGASDGFGISISLGTDIVAISSWFHYYDENGANSVAAAGAVFVFTRSNGVWTQQQKLAAQGTNARTVNSYFGYPVSLSGNTIATGAYESNFDENGANSVSKAGAAYVFSL